MSALRVLKNRDFAGLLLASTIFGAAFPIQLILGGLAGLMLAPSPGFATLPASVQTLAGLLAAVPISLLMGRWGRKVGFALGGVLTLAGAVGAVLAVASQNFVLLCAAHFAMGAGWAAFQYFRFAAGEVVAQNWRPVAISLMLSSLLISALIGPQVFLSAKDALAPLPFAGAYAATGVIGLLGLIPLALVRMPHPTTGAAQQRPRMITALSALRRRPVRRAVIFAAVSQGVMAFMMIPTPIAIVGCGLSEETAGDVIRWHIVAMFAPSFVTGFLIQRFGAQRIAVLGLIIIGMSAAAAITGLSAAHFYAALIVLGVGWNFGFIGATTLLDAALSDAEKPAVQGANDTIIALTSTVCAFSSGLVVAAFGWAVVALVSGGLVVAALAVLWSDRPVAAQG